ncbi:MAG: Rne/Rng family ribonuclease [Candidatus Latescibacterota bacterium]|nr:MAG: Rne/Rng family ribonuclease [Candidatus Latescibacterota bacterium]
MRPRTRRHRRPREAADSSSAGKEARRAAKTQILINFTPREVRIAIMEDRELVEFLIEREDSRRTVGDVYLGRVTAVIPGIQAAFVDIGQEKAAFLHVSDVATGAIDPELIDEDDRDTQKRGELPPIENLLKKGQDILVQVRKEAIGTKGPRISSEISLPGRYAVLMPGLDHIGVSKRIDDRRERSRLKQIVKKYRPEGAAIIVRTAGEGVSEEQLRDDIKYLEKLAAELKEKRERASPPAIIHEDVDLTIFALRDILTEEVESIIVDNRVEFERLREYLRTFAPDVANRMRLYEEKTPIFDFYDIESDIEKILESKIWLKKGGYIVIEHTEALVTIDVNTGRFVGKRDQEETILETNLLAAKEIARQLRLRDIGGIIVVDFIDMETEENRRKVYNEFRNLLRKDRSRVRVYPMSDLGIIEVSRKRVRPSLLHYFSEECPYCSGRGKVLSLESMAMKIEQWIRRIGARKKERGILFKLNPVIGLYLREERADNLTELADTYRLRIEIVDDPRLQREEYEIFSLEGDRNLKAQFE